MDRLTRRLCVGLLLVLLLVVFRGAPEASPYRHAGWATNAMVVSDSEIASQVGAEILERGGNAVDGAVATGFALAVTFPWAGNLGGGGFAVVHLADGKEFTLDFREVAPAGAHRDLYLDEKGDVIDDLSLFTHLAAGVPGSTAGLLRMWEEHGSGAIDRETLLEPAIALARDGFVLGHDMAARLNSNRDHLSRDEEAKSIFVRELLWEPGDRLVQPDLARTLDRIAKLGSAGFYQGETAGCFVEEMKSGNGIISEQDLESYETRYRDPVRGTFRGYEVLSMGPPSSGGVLIVQLLNMLGQYPLEELGWNSTDYIHLLTECFRRAYADRAEHLADPDHWEVPTAKLCDPGYARERSADISMMMATPSSDVSAGSLAPLESDETTHFSVADARGNAVSVTTTLNTAFGTGIVVDGTGVLLNNEMDDFSAKPGVPNYYGLVGKEANAVGPGKRMLSSMSPTIILREGEPLLVLGSPGGSRIISSVLQVILNVLVFEMPVGEAVAVPRVHAQWLPDKVYFEEHGLAQEIVERLETRGHAVEQFRSYIGRVNAIQYAEDGLYAGPDIRGAAAAAGY